MRKQMTLVMELALLVSAVLCVSSCASKSSSDDLQGGRIIKVGTVDEKDVRYTPLSNYDLELELISPERLFYAGDDKSVMRFKLRNHGKNQITIPEWYMKESSNIRFYYLPAASGPAPAFDKAKWSVWKPLVQAPVTRMPLELNGNGSILIECKPGFISGMDASKLPAGGSFFVVAELNLESVAVHSGTFRITVK